MSLNQLPTIGDWITELANMDEALRPGRLAEMKVLVRQHGGCGSLQTANGLPCRRPPKAGYTVCRKHGERAPQTMAKAERALAVARMPAIDVLMDELDQFQENTCDVCGYPSHSLKARKHIAGIAFKLLDRTGFGPRSTIDLTARKIEEVPRDVSQLTPGEFLELQAMLESEDQFWSRVNARIASTTARDVLAPVAARALLSSSASAEEDHGREENS